MNPSVFARMAKTRDRAPIAGRMTAKNNCPSFHRADPDREWIWEALRLPDHALREAVFPERVDPCSRELQRFTTRK